MAGNTPEHSLDPDILEQFNRDYKNNVGDFFAALKKEGRENALMPGQQFLVQTPSENNITNPDILVRPYAIRPDEDLMKLDPTEKGQGNKTYRDKDVILYFVAYDSDDEPIGFYRTSLTKSHNQNKYTAHGMIASSGKQKGIGLSLAAMQDFTLSRLNFVFPTVAVADDAEVTWELYNTNYVAGLVETAKLNDRPDDIEQQRRSEITQKRERAWFRLFGPSGYFPFKYTFGTNHRDYKQAENVDFEFNEEPILLSLNVNSNNNISYNFP